MTNAQLVREYLAWLRDVRGNRPLTIYNYAAVLDPLLSWLGDQPLRAATLEDLEAFLLRPRTKTRGPKAAPSTLRREMATLRGLYGYLVKRGHVERNPALLLVVPRKPRRAPRVISDALWLDLWRHESLTDEARVMLGLGFYCGLRRAEIASLRTSQVDLADRRLIRFERKGGGNSGLPFGTMLDIFERDLPHLRAQDFMPALERLHATRPRDALLMPWAEQIDAIVSKRSRYHPLPAGTVDPQIAAKRLYTILRDTGLSGAFSMHCLRYSCATNLARALVPVQMIQMLLGHSSIETTLIYVRASHVELDEWFRNGNLRREVGRF